MNVENIEINTQSSIRIKLNKVIYFDPFKIEEFKNDADIIFITHNHYDHMDLESIEKVKNDNTIVVAPLSMEEVIRNIKFKDYIFLSPNDEINIENIHIKAVPAYNLEKPFHPRTNNWLGYIITYNNISYYIAGDTDKTKEAESVKCDIALIPIGGHFTMNVDEATELINIIKPKLVIPTHYGTIIGDPSNGKTLKTNLQGIEVIERLTFK